MFDFRYLGFVLLTILFWGIYGPLLHDGQVAMGAAGELSRVRPLICVGLAYMLIAVLVPVIVLVTRGETGRWTLGGLIWSLIAGTAGVLGAVGIIVAFENHGSPIYVMPLVFGGAPVVNTLVTMFMNRTLREASLAFYLGVLVVAIGAAGVMYFKPGVGSVKALAFGEVLWVAAGIGLTALCWGSYGPMLHRGQAKMAGSRLRPFLCVGIAYLVLAVVAPLILQSLRETGEAGGWTLAGTLWSLAAGAAGAVGALGIIYAFNFGGKPILVMPLVFGGAPVVNTFYEIFREGEGAVAISQFFYLSLGLVILGAVTVLITAPRSAARVSGPGAA